MAYTMIGYSNIFKNPNGDTIVEGRFEKDVDGVVETLTRVEFDVWMEDSNGEHGNYIGKVVGVHLGFQHLKPDLTIEDGFQSLDDHL